MKAKYFECDIYVQLFDNGLEDKLREICKEFGFKLEIDEEKNFYTCFGKDNLFDVIKQRTLFILKYLLKDNGFKVLDYKIQGIIIDSKINDDFNKIIRGIL